MKLSVEFEVIPAIGVLLGYEEETGFIIMLPFFCIKIKRIKAKRRALEPVLSKHKGVENINVPKVELTMDKLGTKYKDGNRITIKENVL